MPAFGVHNKTAGAAAPKSLIELAAPANGRVKIRGFTVGNTAETSTEGVEFTLQRLSAAGTGTAYTPEKMDPDSPAARSSAKSTMTANGAPTGEPSFDVGFDVLGSYIVWFPPGAEIWVVNSGLIDLRKVVGADTSRWAASLIFEE